MIVEAARAIHDLPIETAQGQLAQLVENPNLPEPVLLRAVNAQFRLGQSENAAYLISLAQQKSASETVRIRALKALKDWSKPPASGRHYGPGAHITKQRSQNRSRPPETCAWRHAQKVSRADC